MKTMFVLSAGAYSDYQVLAVCEDEKTAIAWRDAMAADEECHCRDVGVEVLPLVEAGVVPFKVTTYQRHADLRDNGQIVGARELSTTDWAINCLHGPPPVRPRVRYVRAPYHNDEGGCLEVRGDNPESVARTFAEKVAMWRAGSFGGPGVRELIEDPCTGEQSCK